MANIKITILFIEMPFILIPDKNGTKIESEKLAYMDLQARFLSAIYQREVSARLVKKKAAQSGILSL